MACNNDGSQQLRQVTMACNKDQRLRHKQQATTTASNSSDSQQQCQAITMTYNNDKQEEITMADTQTLSEENALDKVVFYAFDEAREKLEQSGGFEPFTVILAGEQMHVESHTGDDAAECFNSARQTVIQMSELADAYVFCYDGYVNTDDGVLDAIVAERAAKSDELGEAFALVYEILEDDEGSIDYNEEIYSLGEATSLFTAEEFTADQLIELEDLEDLEDTEDFDAHAGHTHSECGCGCGDK
jgi:hypothetical protein